MRQRASHGLGRAWQAGKTECKWGHPLTGDNLHVRTDGKRSCNECNRRRVRDIQRRRRAEARAERALLPPAPPRLCSVDGCDRPHNARGYCQRHYGRLIVHGRVELPERDTICAALDCDAPRRRKDRLCSSCRYGYKLGLRIETTPAFTPITPEMITEAVAAIDAGQSVRAAARAVGLTPARLLRFLPADDGNRCTGPGCTRRSTAKRLCMTHYTQQCRGIPLSLLPDVSSTVRPATTHPAA